MARSRTFCCCLPVRLGVFVSHHCYTSLASISSRFHARFCPYWPWLEAPSLLQLAGFKSPNWVSQVFFSDTTIFVTNKPTEQHPLAKTDEIAVWIQSSLLSLLVLLAVFGWVLVFFSLHNPKSTSCLPDSLEPWLKTDPWSQPLPSVSLYI